MKGKCIEFKYTRACELQQKSGVSLLPHILLAFSVAQIALYI